MNQLHGPDPQVMIDHLMAAALDPSREQEGIAAMDEAVSQARGCCALCFRCCCYSRCCCNARGWLIESFKVCQKDEGERSRFKTALHSHKSKQIYNAASETSKKARHPGCCGCCCGPVNKCVLRCCKLTWVDVCCCPCMICCVFPSIDKQFFSKR